MKEIVGQHKFFVLFLTLIIYFVMRACTENVSSGVIIDVFFSMTIIAGIYAISDHRKSIFFITVFLAVLLLLLQWIAKVSPFNLSLETLRYTISTLFLLIILVVTYRHTFRQNTITSDTIFGSINGYLLLGFIWSMIYAITAQLNPDAFAINLSAQTGDAEISHFIYYSFVTLTTLGYGDIVPKAPLAHTLAWLEAVTGQLYLTIVIAQLIGQYISQKTMEKHHVKK